MKRAALVDNHRQQHDAKAAPQQAGEVVKASAGAHVLAGQGAKGHQAEGWNIITVVIPRPIKGQYIEVDRLKS